MGLGFCVNIINYNLAGIIIEKTKHNLKYERIPKRIFFITTKLYDLTFKKMKKNIFLTAIFTLLVLSFALGQTGNEKSEHSSKVKQEKIQTNSQPVNTGTISTGLILQEEEGERMVRRWGLPMTIKIDPINGGSKQLLVGTEDLPPGRSIPVHKHSHCDEVLIVLKGNGIVQLGEQRREVSAGAIVFIPENEWVGLENIGQDTARVVFIFSALGFDKYLRATSVPEGQEVIPFTPQQLADIRKKYKDVITFKDK